MDSRHVLRDIGLLYEKLWNAKKNSGKQKTCALESVKQKALEI